MFLIMLSKKFKPKKTYDLIRVGQANDGGYLICRKSCIESNLLFSFGISDDFSFEEKFKDINNCKIIAFDPSSNNNFFIKKILLDLFKLNLKQFIKDIINFFNFLFFFSQKNCSLIKKKVGINTKQSFKSISIKDIFNLADNSSKIFFKIDIEGSEYRIFDEILLNQNNFTGIGIELHDVDIHMDKIKKFVKELDMELVHIHPQNPAHVAENNIPTQIELTFAKKPKMIGPEVKRPHVLDQPANPYLKDIELFFEKK